MRKKGQLTLIIIVGLLLLVGVVVFVVTTNSAKKKLMEREASQAINLNAEGKVLQSIVDDCIEDSFKKARDHPENYLGMFGDVGFMEDFMMDPDNPDSIQGCIRRATAAKDETGAYKDYYFYEERGIQLSNAVPQVAISVDQDADTAVSVKVTYPRDDPLMLKSKFDSKTIELREFTYSFPLVTQARIRIEMRAGFTYVKGDHKIKSGDGDLLVIIKDGTKVGTDSDYTPLSGDSFDIKVVIAQDPDSNEEDSLGKIIYRIQTIPEGDYLFFHHKIEVRKDFSSDLAMQDRSKSFSFFIKIDEIELPAIAQEILGIDSVKEMPVPTYGDTVNNNLVGYLPMIGDELYFYEENCLEIINSYLPECPVTTDTANPVQIDFECMCDGDYIKPNDRGIICYSTPGSVLPCQEDSKAPESLPCKCDRFIIYCQDTEVIPRMPPPGAQEILAALGIWPLDLDNIDVLLELFDLETATRLITDGPEAALPEVLEAVAEKDPDRLEQVKGLFLIDNIEYDPLVCAPRDYTTVTAD